MTFASALCAAAGRHGWDPEHMLRVMMSESGINPAAHNPNGDASGLIQFMPQTLINLGWRDGHAAFRKLTAEEQVPYVEAYYSPYPDLDSPARFYLATFLPALLTHTGSREMTFVLCAANGPLGWAYAANKVFDRDHKGYITLGDLAKAIERACVGPHWELKLGELRHELTPPDRPTARELPSDQTLPGLGRPVGTDFAFQVEAHGVPPVEALADVIAEHQRKCPRCAGTGADPEVEGLCGNCDGTGKV